MCTAKKFSKYSTTNSRPIAMTHDKFHSKDSGRLNRRHQMCSQNGNKWWIQREKSRTLEWTSRGIGAVKRPIGIEFEGFGGWVQVTVGTQEPPSPDSRRSPPGSPGRTWLINARRSHALSHDVTFPILCARSPSYSRIAPRNFPHRASILSRGPRNYSSTRVF
jgi:hypothetical protein